MSARRRTTKSGADPEHAYVRLEHLYEISKLLTRFESIEQTIQPIVTLVSRTLPLRNAVLVLNRDGRTQQIVYAAEGLGPDGRAEALSHAQTSFAYLSGPHAGKPVDPEGDRTPVHPLPGLPVESPRPKAEAHRRFVVLPLVVDHGAVFGVFQWEGVARLEERDLWFMNAVVNQVAIAVSRQAILEANQAAEIRIRDQLEFVRTITDSLGEGVVAIDREGRITFFNPAAERLFGWTEQAATGEHIEKVIPLRREDGTPIPPGEGLLMRPVATGEPCRSDELLVTRRDLAVLPVSVTSCPVRQDGQVAGAVAVIRDTLEARRAAKAQRFLVEASTALASSLEYSHTLSTLVRLCVPMLGDLCFVDVLEDGEQLIHHETAFADPDIQSVAEQLRRFEPRAGGQTPWQRVFKTGQVVLLHDLASAAQGYDALDREYAALMGALSLRSMMVVPLLSGGKPVGALTFIASGSDRYYETTDFALAEDIARRAMTAIDNARLYQEARRDIQVREDILAVVSHDLRNPLSSIFLNAAFLVKMLSVDEDKERTRGIATRIQHSARQMNNLIGDLLDFASIEAGHMSVEKKTHAADQLLQEALDMLEETAAQRSLRLTYELTGGDFEVLGDNRRILQVFSNLVGNAIKFTPEGGTITLRAERRSDEVWFSVTDSGLGIPPEALPHIFKRFWRAIETGRMGIGLGLSIARGIVEAHGGRIWVQSQVGVGTTVYFSLPCQPDDPAGGLGPGTQPS